MSWIEDLYETYECCAGREPDGKQKLMPISHTTQQAQIEIVLDGGGEFRRARVLEKDEGTTLIPCTEDSGGRAGSKPVNHPLCDKLQYVAGDFLKYGGEVTSGFTARPDQPHEMFLQSLRDWAHSDCGHPKLNAILRYVERSRIVGDLIAASVLPVDDTGRLLKRWIGDKNEAPPIFKVLQNAQAPEEAFIRWQVEAIDDRVTATWLDQDLISAWVAYYQRRQTGQGTCMVTGEEMSLAVQHPSKLRHAGDKAKLISSNDTSGYTFRGKFLEAGQALTVGFIVTQKAHNALRWLIERQSYRNGDQVVVSWALTGSPVPHPLSNTLELFGGIPDDAVPVAADTGQAFSLRLKKAIAGYQAKLAPTEDVVVMALDSATPGRMAITFYRKLKGSEFLDRIRIWHAKCAWSQNFGKERRFVGAPAPKDIAEVAHGKRLDDKLRTSTVERLLPCIVDSQSIPRDLVESVVRRACNRVALDDWEWEKCLGVACALYRGYHTERSYDMSIEPGRVSRDYLYGRLLAIADSIEGYALSMTQESQKRETNAARMMQRFADRPFSTWRNIALSLAPYKARLQAGSDKTAGFLAKRQRLLDEVMTVLDSVSDRTSDAPLTGEFLLGYHCQRQAFRPGVPSPTVGQDVPEEIAA